MASLNYQGRHILCLPLTYCFRISVALTNERFGSAIQRFGESWPFYSCLGCIPLPLSYSQWLLEGCFRLTHLLYMPLYLLASVGIRMIWITFADTILNKTDFSIPNHKPTKSQTIAQKPILIYARRTVLRNMPRCHQSNDRESSVE